MQVPPVIIINPALLPHRHIKEAPYAVAGPGAAFVEVSTNGGASWQTASGTNPWNFDWTPDITQVGVSTIKLRVRNSTGGGVSQAVKGLRVQ